MKTEEIQPTDTLEWFAIKSRQANKAEEVLNEYCDEVFFPQEVIRTKDRAERRRALIPRVLFVKTSRKKVLELERRSRENPESFIPFWIYRYPTDRKIQVISPRSIELLRLLTSGDTTQCEIFNKTDFRENERVRVTGGPYQGYEGFVQRVKKNKHVIVKLEGICLIMLPFIHPDLLEPVETQNLSVDD
ncbi:MAG: hypothetical protein HDT09_01220 [Bacteroidales bacterium]|nr:hypothetical protein [Bacteroidales bacterium]